MRPHLVFVYNADSGLFNTVTDIAHKILSPTTYSCRLCELTHSYFTVKKEWTGFLEELEAKLEFLHRDELQEKYGVVDISLPVILIAEGEQLQPWIVADEINACQSMAGLEELIRRRLDETIQPPPAKEI